MPRQKKYISFQESEPFESLDKKGEGTGEVRMYVSITCPHCNTIFTRLPEIAVPLGKASQCKAHLAECDVYNGKPVERKRRRTMQQWKDELRADLRADMEARFAEERLTHYAHIWSRLQLEPPPPTTQEEFTRRLEVCTGSKGARPISADNLFAQIRADKSAVQHFKALLHPDRNGKAPSSAIPVREALLEQLLYATSGTNV